MLVTLQLSDFNDFQAPKIFGCLEKVTYSHVASQDSRVQLELVKQLIVMIHLNSASAALVQT